MDECPVSFLSEPRADEPHINGRRAIRLVRLWQKAKRQNTTLSKLMDSEEAWVEDVEETLENAEESLKSAVTRDAEKRR
jgi:hypothetical protein